MSARRTVSIASPVTGEAEWQAVREPLESGWLTQGPKVAAFEAGFAARHDARRGVATTSCTTALHLVLAALGIGPGDEVIVPSFTWVATANVVRFVGATPVFVDVDAATYNIDPLLVAAAATPRTRAAIPVHLFGLCADVPAIASALPASVAVIEDAACAAGAALGEVHAGSLGAAGCFSFHPRKSITTGEGGMILTNDGSLADVAVRLRNHGAHVSEEVRHHSDAPFMLPEFDEVGFNYRMTDVQAAIGLVQLAKLDGFIAERDMWAKWYTEELADIGWLVPPAVPAGYLHGWQSYVLRLAKGAPIDQLGLMRAMHEMGVATRPGTHCVTELGAYKDWAGRCPVGAELQRTTVAIPLHNRMDADDFAYVVECLRAL